MADLLKRKGPWFLASLCVTALMVIGVILTLVLDGGHMKINDNSKTLIIIFGIIGIAIDLVGLFLEKRIPSFVLPILGALAYAICLGRCINLVAYPISDLATGVNWFGGNLGVYLSLTIFYLVGMVYDIVKSFAK